MTTGKTITLTRQTFVGKVMCLLFNMLSSLGIAFLPGSNCLLISWLRSPSVVILEPRKIKSDTVSTVSPSISHEVVGNCIILKSSDITLPTKSNQGYGFSSRHVWMWELDYKESWALKNWWFWTVMLEKTLESPLYCKENNQSRSLGKSVLSVHWMDWC